MLWMCRQTSAGADLQFTEADEAESSNAKQTAIYELYALLQTMSGRQGKVSMQLIMMIFHNASFTLSNFRSVVMNIGHCAKVSPRKRL